MDSCPLLKFPNPITECRNGIEATGDGKPVFVTIPVTCQTMYYVPTESY